MSRLRLLGLALAAALTVSGCTGPVVQERFPPIPVPPLPLLHFGSCGELLDDLRAAAVGAVGSGGLAGTVTPGDGDLSGPDDGQPDPLLTAGDPPDLMKSDGSRIVTVRDGVLRVVDAYDRRRTGVLDLGLRGVHAELLLLGLHALVLADRGASTEVLLADVGDTPRVLSRYRVDGTLVSARRSGLDVQVVLRVAPRIALPVARGGRERDRLDAARAAVRGAGLDAWLPRWSVTTGGGTTTGWLGCDSVRRPASYAGTSLVLLLDFNLNAQELDDGDPVAVIADDVTVQHARYQVYLAVEPPGPGARRTDLYSFSTGSGPAWYGGSASVPGALLDRHALSEWDGHLRVATTGGTIHVLRNQDGEMRRTGTVAVPGARSVRFIGSRGYALTADPAGRPRVVDLADPAKPAVAGELPIGSSARLLAAGENRLIGVTAGDRSGTTGLALFDVSDATNPRRLARHELAAGRVEADPRAVLYRPESGLLVVLTSRPVSAAVVLRVADAGFTRLNVITQPPAGGAAPVLSRALITRDRVWTLSGRGLLASYPSVTRGADWLPD